MKSLGFAAILVSLYAMVACSASTTRAGTGSSTTGNGGEGGAGGGGGEGQGGQLVCDVLDNAACLQCCTDEHPVGSETLDNLFYTHCGCENGATCADLCDTQDDATDLCVGENEFNFAIDNEECTSCLLEIADKGTDRCVTTVQNECADQDDCLDFGKCQRKCPVAE